MVLIRRLGLAMFALMLLFGSGLTAYAASSPAGIVNDEAGVFTSAQLTQLDQGLTGLRYQYRVIILREAFAGDKPADADARFRTIADQLLADRKVPQDAILITVAMKERLLDIGAWKNGPVNQEFLSKTGTDFGAHFSGMLERFRGPAGAGDIPGGILAAARYIETIIPAGGTTQPAPAQPTPVQPVRPAPDPAQPVKDPGPPPDTAPFLWGFLGLVVLGGAGFWTARYWQYRRGMRDAIRVRDAFLGDLLSLLERELPMAKGYRGEETRKLVEVAQAAADRALQTQQEGEELRHRAESMARFGRFQAAREAAATLMDRYQSSSSAFKAGLEAWAPISEALRNWEQILVAAEGRQAEAGKALGAERRRTGWTLTDLEGRINQASAVLAEAKGCRDDDPVRAVRLVREAQSGFEAAIADLADLEALTKALDTGRQARQQVADDVAEARRTLGLRFVELSPDPALGRADAALTIMTGTLPDGRTGETRKALEEAREATAEAQQILNRYREALREYPEKTAALNAELPVLQTEEHEAGGILRDLEARYAVEDWTDVRMVARELATLQGEVRQGLQDVTLLTSPAEQRYLRAVELLNGLLARREALHASLATLRGRPGELDTLARRARSQAEAMASALQAAEQRIYREDLRLPAGLSSNLDDARRRLLAVQNLGAAVPLPVHRWDRESADGAALAASLHGSVDDLARRAASARAELARAHQMAGAAMGYARYDRHSSASVLDGALSEAEMALGRGDYDGALADCSRAMAAAAALERAYREHIAEQERQRREEEERRNQAFSHSSGSSSSFDSNSSGGSGSFGSSSSSSSSDSNNSSGGSGSW